MNDGARIRAEIRTAAESLLAAEPSPAVRVRLLRDVVGEAPDSPRHRSARAALAHSRVVTLLAAEQRWDGSWGRLHSADSRSRQVHPTTEFAVRRALSLGLPPDGPILRRAREHLSGIVETGACADPPQANDRWTTGVRLFAASTLALIDPHAQAVRAVRALWQDIARRTFRSGAYDPDAEAAAHRVLSGASVRGSYLVLANRYVLELLSQPGPQLRPDIEAALLDWLAGWEDGVGYLCVPLRPPAGTFASPSAVDRWFVSQEIFSHFASWWERTGDVTSWLWERRRPDGTWDFGTRPPRSEVLPLSDDWRSLRARVHDWTARVLVLLHRFHAP